MVQDESQPEPDPSPESADSGSANEEGAEQKKSKLPRCEPVFGKHGWMIVLLPFLLYLIGNQITSYLDNSRAFTLVHEQQHKVVRKMRQALHDIAGELQPALQPQIKNSQEIGATYEFNEEMEAALARLNWSEMDRLANLPEELKSEDLDVASQSYFNADPELRGLMKKKSYDEMKEELQFLIRILELDEDGMKRQVLAEYYAHEHRNDPEELESEDVAQFGKFQRDRTWYPTLYTINIAVATVALFIVFPFYFRAPFKITYWSVIVGVVGIFVWVGIWWIKNNVLQMGDVMKGNRAAFNPFEELKDNPTWMWQFMAIRFWGLVIVVPFLEEFFLRGWLMRYIDDPDWDTIPLGLVTKLSGPGIAIYAAATHPETLAAVVWFSMVTWLYWKTKSIWDCVVAHLTTNLLLGLFVLKSGIWQLW